MCPHHTNAGDVPVLHSVRRVFFHLREHIADYAGVVIRGLLRPRHVDCNIGELRP